MTKLCIPPNIAVKLNIAIESGEVSVTALRKASSAERNKIFKKYLGDEELAKKLNVGYETRINSTKKDILTDYINRELTRVPKNVKKELADQLLDIEKEVLPEFNKLNKQGLKVDKDGFLVNKKGDFVDAEGKKLKEGESPIQTEVDDLKFLETLAEHKVGNRLSEDAAKVMFKQAQEVNKLKYGYKGKDGKFVDGAETVLTRLEKTIDKDKFKDNFSEELNRLADKDEAFQKARIEYGRATVDLSNMSSDAVLFAKEGYTDIAKANIALWRKGIKIAGKVLMESFGTTKSLLSTFDNSLWGRQGMKMLFTHPAIWGRNFIKSFPDIARTWFSPKTKRAKTFNPYTGEFETGRFSAIQSHVYDEVRAEIMSRPNALKGYYSAARNDYGLILDTEEAFPVSFLEKTPGIGRVHKGFEVAYNSGAMRMRADLADVMIRKGEKAGLNMLEKKNADAMGAFVGSFTGRGDLGKAEVLAGDLGTVLFSPRFFKSQLDTLGFAFGASGTKYPPEIRKMAAAQTWQYLLETAGVLALADLAGITELDPRSSDFGNIIIGDVKIDVTGGNRSLLNLISKLYTGTYKQSVTGIVTESRGGVKDALGSFVLNKAAPIPSVAMQLIDKEYFGGEVPTFTTPEGIFSFVKQIGTPISTQTVEEAIQTQDNALDILIYITADFFGGSTQPYQIRPQGGAWKELLNSDRKEYEKKVKELNDEVKELLVEKRKDKSYQKKTKEEQDKELLKEINRIKKNTLR